jgi:hypothetical protein
MREALLKDKEIGRKVYGNIRNFSLPLILIALF